MPANPIGRALRNRRAGHHTLVWARPDLQAPESFTLTSPAFDHATPIPERHRGWAGPMPPRSHGPHTYAFQLYALDYHPDLPDKFTLTDALEAMTGHVIARARLDGTYENV